MNLLDIWGLWSMNLLDIWDIPGIWSATLQDIRKTPGYSGPMNFWMFWACIIKCCQSAKDNLFLDWQPLKSMHPYVLLRDQYQNQRVKNLNILFLNFHSWNCSRILENSFREFSFPGIKKSWKILSWKKIVLEFSQNNLYFPWNLQFWNFPFLKFSIPGILSWNFLFLESYFTEFSCYPRGPVLPKSALVITYWTNSRMRLIARKNHMV